MGSNQTKLTTYLNNPIFLLLSFGIIISLVFQHAFSAEFLNWDDEYYVVKNDLLDSFSFSKLLFLFHPKTYVMGNYHPITILSYAIETAIWGKNAFVFHTTNLLLHVLNTFFVFKIACFFFKRIEISYLLALIFALHPNQVETLLWISDRKDLLSTLFLLLSLWQYLKYVQKPQVKDLVLIFTFFLLACLSKATSVLLPVLFIAHQLIISPKAKWSLTFKVTLFIMLITSFLIGYQAMLAQKSNVVVDAINPGMLHSFLFSGYALAHYIIHLFIPIHLAPFYPYPAETNYFYLLSWIFMIILLFLLYKRDHRVMLFFISFFIISIFLVLQIFPVGNAIAANRYAYFPYIGLFLFLGKLIESIYTLRIRYLLLFLIIISGYVSYQYSKNWVNSKALWSHEIEVYPAVSMSYINRGASFENENKPELALADYEKAIGLNDSKMGYIRKSAIENQKGETTLAIRTLNYCIEKHPNYEVAYNNRALLLKKAFVLNKAIEDLDKAIEISPNYYEAYLNRANIYLLLKKVNEAEADCKKALEINPAFVEGYNTLGNIYASQKMYDQAYSYYKKGLEIDSNNVTILKNLEMLQTITKK